MKKLLLFLAIWWTCPLDAKPAQALRVVTWNLQWFPGGRMGAPKEDQDRHIEMVREEIRKLAPDILLLQEVGSQAALEETLAPLGEEWKVAIVSRFKQGNFLSGQQLAIAAKIPADAAWSEPWQRGWAEAPRGYAYASFLIGGKRLGIYCLHLKSNLGNAAANTSKREDAIEQLFSPEQQAVSDERFERVQQVLASIREKHEIFVHERHRGSILGGPGYCGVCSMRIYAKTSSRRMADGGKSAGYYLCASQHDSRAKKPGNVKCSNSWVAREKLDALASAFVERFLEDQEFVLAVLTFAKEKQSNIVGFSVEAAPRQSSTILSVEMHASSRPSRRVLWAFTRQSKLGREF